MTGWQLADLLGVHEHQIDLEELPELPVRVLLELARRLDMNPADLMPGADELFERPRQRQVVDRRPARANHDALTVITALAYAYGRRTTDALAAAVLEPSPPRRGPRPPSDPPQCRRPARLASHPARRVHRHPAPRLLAPHQVDALAGRTNAHPAARGPIQPAEAEVLLRVWVDGGIDTTDAAQRQALEDLAAAEMVTRGDIIDRFHDNVLYSLRMLPEPPAPTDTDSAPPLS
ncbi:hypothetical protein OG311_37455 [Streptomyces sp. NBC_01343]|uniref:hypothetical protein n=1 Tax=Streptomyces sp. NBC_01343 TaxID=2903832 RepID=UPI002E158E83|nr:hypothetical protein OG311_37455 [Streptomyces sp. NBC_01343]